MYVCQSLSLSAVLINMYHVCVSFIAFLFVFLLFVLYIYLGFIIADVVGEDFTTLTSESMLQIKSCAWGSGSEPTSSVVTDASDDGMSYYLGLMITVFDCKMLTYEFSNLKL